MSNSKARSDYVGYCVAFTYFVISQAKIEYLRSMPYQILIMVFLALITVKTSIAKKEYDVEKYNTYSKVAK